MKTIKILIIAVLCAFFVGCKEYGEKRIVNFITLDKDSIALYYYNFNKEDKFLKEERENTGIKNTLIQMLSENQYDLKLCRYAIITSDITNDINELFFALTDSRFAPDIIILEGETNLDAEEYIKADNTSYPLYNYKINNNLISCVIEKFNENEKNIVINNKVYKKLYEQQSAVFDILDKSEKHLTYVFESDGKKISAELDNINTFYYIKANTVGINITATMKSYKGMAAGEGEKRLVKELLEKDIKQNVIELISDKTIAETFNLLWYSNIENIESFNINVNIL